jgi:hypothetical protein
MFQLWDTDDNNVIGMYSSEQAALRIVRDGVQMYGADAFQAVALGGESSSGQLHVIAEGAELVRLATARATTNTPERKVS